jgi:hypothetical protein
MHSLGSTIPYWATSNLPFMDKKKVMFQDYKKYIYQIINQKDMMNKSRRIYEIVFNLKKKVLSKTMLKTISFGSKLHIRNLYV